MEREPIVFVVDEDCEMRERLTRLAARAGLRVRALPSAEEFLENLDPDQPGCVVLELRLPGMDGLALQERLLRHGPQIPLIFATACGDVATAVRAAKGGAVDFLEKPVQDQVLLKRIRQAISVDAQIRTTNAERRLFMERLSQLTAPERETMGRIINGQPNDEIAAQLGVDVETVELQRGDVLRKMHVDTVVRFMRLSQAYGAGTGSDGDGIPANPEGRSIAVGRP